MRPRRSRGLWLAAALVALSTCGGVDTIRVSETASTTIPQGTLLEQLVGDLGFGEFASFDLAQTTELQNQGVERHQIDAVFIEELTLTITDPPSGQDFTFLDRLEFYAEADGLPRVLVASGGPFPADATTVSLELEDVDLSPYAVAPSMDITTEVTGRRPQNETTVEAEIVLLVDVNLGGVLCGAGADSGDGG